MGEVMEELGPIGFSKEAYDLADRMTETIYEKKTGIPEKRYQLPNNRRQIGHPGQAEPEVFIEDYAFSYAKGLSERDYAGCVVGVLVGEKLEGAQGDKLLVRGVLEAREVLRQDAVCFTEENWTGIYRDIREYFPNQQIVGWFLGGPGFLLEDTERQKKIQQDNFGGGDKVLLKMDSIEKEQSYRRFPVIIFITKKIRKCRTIWQKQNGAFRYRKYGRKNIEGMVSRKKRQEAIVRVTDSLQTRFIFRNPDHFINCFLLRVEFLPVLQF